MNRFLSDLVNAWRQTPLRRPPFFLLEDKAILSNSFLHKFRNYKNFVNNPDFWTEQRDKLHTGLIPMPYSGDIKKAKIYVLALNPGFSPQDYYAETYDDELKRERIRELRQEKLDKDYPFHHLNPTYSWSSGWRYWHSRFDSIVKQLSEQKNMHYVRALKLFSRNVACLELVPYHSKNFYLPSKVVTSLQSVKLMKRFVQGYVWPRAKRGRAIIIVTRRVRLWDIPSHENVIQYSSGQARSAYFNSYRQKIIGML